MFSSSSFILAVMVKGNRLKDVIPICVPLKASKRMTFIGSGAPLAHDASSENVLRAG